MMAWANEVLEKDAASTLSTIPRSNGTMTRRQDELSNFAEEKMVEIQQRTINQSINQSRLMRAQFIIKLSWSMLDSSMKMV